MINASRQERKVQIDAYIFIFLHTSDLLGHRNIQVLNDYISSQSIKILISASLLFNRFMKDVRIGLLQLNMIYEGQSTSDSVLST